MDECSITNPGPSSVLKHLDCGNYGSAYLVFHAKFGIVAKREFRWASNNDRFSTKVKKAADRQKSHLHPNIVTLYDVVYTSTHCLVFVDYMKYGTADQFIKDYDVPADWRIQILHDIAAAMAYLHGRQPMVLHGDLTCNSILIGDGYRAKLADIGIFRILKESCNNSMKEASPKTRVKYIAPEYFTDPRSINSDKFDVYSFAILCWEILSLKEAYLEFADEREIRDNVVKGGRPNIGEIDTNVPKAISKIVKKCWNKKEFKRPTFKSISDSSFVQIRKIQLDLVRSYASMKDQELTRCKSICSQEFEKLKLGTELENGQMRPEFKPAQMKDNIRSGLVVITADSTDSDDPYDAHDSSENSCSTGFHSEEELDGGKNHSLSSLETIQNLQYRGIPSLKHARNLPFSKHNTSDLHEQPSDHQLLFTSQLDNYAINSIAPTSGVSRQRTIEVYGRSTKTSDPLPNCFASELYDKRLLEAGGFGVVYKAEHQKYGTVAFKKLRLFNAEILKEEAKIQMNFDHRNIIKCLAVVVGELEYGLLLEYAANGCIMNYIRNNVPNCEFRSLKISEVCSGMAYLHSRIPPIVHGDLKAGNILLGEQLQAKISDFGFSKLRLYSRSDSLNSTQQGTFTHMPPEIWRNPNLRKIESYDVYSFGIMMWEIFTGEQPFEGDGINASILSVWIPRDKRPGLEKLPSEISNEFRYLIEQCWHGTALNRPPFEQIKQALEKCAI